MVQISSFVLPVISYYHACEHITRGKRADSCTHCLHARRKCKAGVNGVSALTEVTISLLQWGIDRFAEQTRSASPRRGIVNQACELTGYGDRLWHMVSTVWRGGKYAEKRRNILIIFIKCTIYDKSKDDRGCEAAIALQQSRGEMRHAPVSGSCRCVVKGKATHRKPAKNLPFYYI